MARSRPFNLTAQLNIQGPNNLRPVIANIRRQLGTLNTNLTLNIDRNASRNIQNLNSQVNTLNNTLSQTAVISQQVSASLGSISSAANNVQQNTNRASGALNNAQAASSGLNNSLTQSRNIMEDFGRQSALAVRRFVAFSTAAGPIYGLTRAISSAFNEFVNFDKEVIRLIQVTGQSKTTISSLTDEVTRLSTTLGVSSGQLVTVATTLAQAGLSASQTTTALEALAKASLAPSFDDLNNTVEGSIALMKQFGISSSQLESALGSVNAVAAAFAVEAGDIIAAIQRTGGVFAAASNGVSTGTDALNEFIAVFTSVRATTRESAETIATGLRTIFTRIQRGSTIDFLRELGIELTDAEGKFIGPYKAIERLSSALRTLDPRDLKYSQIVEELGGFRQIGKVIPLIQQFATAQEALKVAQEGSTSLSKDAVTAQQSLANQFAKVREQFLAFVRSIGESQTFRTITKLVLGLASSLISVGNAFKPILPYLAILGAIRGTRAAISFGAGFFGGGGGAGGTPGQPTTSPTGGGTGPNTGTQAQQQNILNNSTVVANTNAITAHTTALGSNTTALNNVQTALNTMQRTFVNGINAIGRVITQRGAGGPNGGQALNKGGKVLAFARGGVVPGSGNRDTVPAMLQPGEFVIRKKAVETIGANKLHQMNKYASGGPVTASELKSVELKKYIKSANSSVPEKKFKDGTYLTDSDRIIFDKFEFGVKAPKNIGFSKFETLVGQKVDQQPLGGNAPVDIPPGPKYKYPIEVRNRIQTTPDRILLDKLLRHKLKNATNNKTPLISNIKSKDPNNLYAGKIGIAYNTSKIKRDRFKTLNLGGFIQKFEGGGTVEEIAATKGISLQQAILEQLQALGGAAGIKKIIGPAGGSPLARQVLRKNTIEAGIDLQESADFINRALAIKGTGDAAEEARIAKLKKVAVAGLLPIGYNKNFEWALDNGSSIYATVKGFSEQYKEAVAQMQMETSGAASRFAENVQYSNIFGGGEPLVFDFDETLVSGADILGPDGKPDIPKYSDKKEVSSALQKGQLTRLGLKVKELVSANPDFIKQTRILTARPQDTADLLASTLQKLGLPYKESDITGVGQDQGSTAQKKAANLAATEKLIDDNLDNITAVDKAGKKGFLYNEPKPQPALDELIGQGNIEASVVEKALALLGANLPPIEQLESNRAVDFPTGLGRAAQFFGIDPNIPTEVKRTLNGSSFKKAREEFNRFYTEENQFADGGWVQFFKEGAKVRSTKNKRRGAYGTRGFVPLSSKEYADFADKAYAEAGPYGGPGWGEVSGAPMPKVLADYAQKINRYVFETGGAGLAIGKKLVKVPDNIEPEALEALKEDLIQQYDGWYAEIEEVMPFGKAIESNPVDIAKEARSQAAMRAEAENKVYTQAEDAIGAFKETGQLQLDPTMDTYIRSAFPEYITQLQKDIQQTTDAKKKISIQRKLSKAQKAMPDYMALLSGTAVPNAGRVTALSETLYALLDQYGSKDVSTAEIDNIMKALGTKLPAPKKFAKGGSNQDTVPALLTPGEFVINKKAASRIGEQQLNRLNKADKISGFNKGGAVGNIQRFQTGGMPDARNRYSAGFIGSGGLDPSQNFIPLDMLSNQASRLSEALQNSETASQEQTSATEQLARHTLETNRLFGVLNSISPNLAGKFREMSESMGGTTAALGLAATTLSTQLPGLYDTIDRFSGTQFGKSGVLAGVAGGIQQGGASLFAGLNAAKQADFGRAGTITTGLISGIGGAISGYLKSKEQKEIENLRKFLQENNARTETLFGRLEQQNLSPEKRTELLNELDLEIEAADQAISSSLKNSGEDLSSIFSRLADSVSGAAITFAALKIAARRSEGGIIYASTGTYVKYQPKGTDTIPAMLSPGEFVVNAKSTKKNLGLLNAINKNKGGIISPNYLKIGGGLRTLADFIPFVGSGLDLLEGGADILKGKFGSGLGKLAIGGAGLGLDFFSAGLGRFGLGLGKGALKTGAKGIAKTSLGRSGIQAASNISGATRRTIGRAGRGGGNGSTNNSSDNDRGISLATLGMLGLSAGQSAYSFFTGGGPSEAQREAFARTPETLEKRIQRGRLEATEMSTNAIFDVLNQAGGMREGEQREKFLTQAGTSPIVRGAEESALKAAGIDNNVLIEARKKSEKDRTEEEAKAIQIAKESRENLFKEAFLTKSPLDDKQKDAALKRAQKAKEALDQGLTLNEDQKKAYEAVYGVGRKYIAQQTESIYTTERNNRVLSTTKAASENFINAINTIESGLDRASATFSESMLQIDNSMGLLEGRIPKVSRLTENLFGNLRAYSPKEIAKASTNLSKSLGFDKISTGLNITRQQGLSSSTLADTFRDASLATRALEIDLPRIFKENAGATDGNLKQQILDALKAGGLSESAAQSLAEEIRNRANNQTRGGQSVSFGELAQDVPAFLNSIESLKKANELQSKLIKLVNDSLDTYNQKIQEAAEKTLEASQLRADSERTRAEFELSLQNALGRPTSLAEQNAPFERSLREFTTIRGAGGATLMEGSTDAGVLGRRAEQAQAELDRLKREQEAAGAEGMGNPQRDAAMKMQIEIIKKSNEALKKLAEDTSRASNALKKIESLRQVRENKFSTMLGIVANADNAGFMIDFARQQTAKTKIQTGQNVTREDVMLVAENFDKITSLMPPEEAAKFREQLTQQIAAFFGGQDPATIQGILNLGGDPSKDPQIKQAEAVARGFTQQTIRAQEILIRTTEQASQKIMDGLPSAAEEFRRIIKLGAAEAALELRKAQLEQQFGGPNVRSEVSSQLVSGSNIDRFFKAGIASFQGGSLREVISQQGFLNPNTLKQLVQSGGITGELDDGQTFAEAIAAGKTQEVLTQIYKNAFDLNSDAIINAIKNQTVKFDDRQVKALTQNNALILAADKLANAEIDLNLSVPAQQQLNMFLAGLRAFEETRKPKPAAPMANGGVVYASKGSIIGMTPKGTDTVPAMLTPGEFVINKAATARNLPLLKSINSGDNYYNNGGIVYAKEGKQISQEDEFFSQLAQQQERKRSLINQTDTRTGRITSIDSRSGSIVEDSLNPYNKDLGSTDPLKSFGVGALKGTGPTAAGMTAASSTFSVLSPLIPASGPFAPATALGVGALSLGAGVIGSMATSMAQENYLDALAPKTNDKMKTLTEENPTAAMLGGTLPGVGAGLAQQGVRSFAGTVSQRLIAGSASAGIGAGIEYGTTGSVDPTNLGTNFGVGFAQPNMANINNLQKSKAINYNIETINPDQIVYHGSGAAFDRVDMSKVQDGMLGKAFYAGFTNKQGDVASNFASMGANKYLRRHGSLEGFGGGIYSARIKGGISDFAEALKPLGEDQKLLQKILEIFTEQNLTTQRNRYTGQYTPDLKPVLDTSFMDPQTASFNDATSLLQSKLASRIEPTLNKQDYPDTRAESLNIAADQIRSLLVAKGIPGAKDMSGTMLGTGEPMVAVYDPSRINLGSPTVPEYIKPIKKANGGMVSPKYLASGGRAISMTPRGTDTVPAMLTPGEFVVNKAATAKNLPLLKAINNGKTRGYSKGGIIYAADGVMVDETNLDSLWQQHDIDANAGNSVPTYEIDAVFDPLQGRITDWSSFNIPTTNDSDRNSIKANFKDYHDSVYEILGPYIRGTSSKQDDIEYFNFLEKLKKDFSLSSEDQFADSFSRFNFKDKTEFENKKTEILNQLKELREFVIDAYGVKSQAQQPAVPPQGVPQPPPPPNASIFDTSALLPPPGESNYQQQRDTNLAIYEQEKENRQAAFRARRPGAFSTKEKITPSQRRAKAQRMARMGAAQQSSSTQEAINQEPSDPHLKEFIRRRDSEDYNAGGMLYSITDYVMDEGLDQQQEKLLLERWNEYETARIANNAKDTRMKEAKKTHAEVASAGIQGLKDYEDAEQQRKEAQKRSIAQMETDREKKTNELDAKYGISRWWDEARVIYNPTLSEEENVALYNAGKQARAAAIAQAQQIEDEEKANIRDRQVAQAPKAADNALAAQAPKAADDALAAQEAQEWNEQYRTERANVVAAQQAAEQSWYNWAVGGALSGIGAVADAGEFVGTPIAQVYGAVRETPILGQSLRVGEEATSAFVGAGQMLAGASAGVAGLAARPLGYLDPALAAVTALIGVDSISITDGINEFTAGGGDLAAAGMTRMFGAGSNIGQTLVDETLGTNIYGNNTFAQQSQAITGERLARAEQLGVPSVVMQTTEMAQEVGLGGLAPVSILPGSQFVTKPLGAAMQSVGRPVVAGAQSAGRSVVAGAQSAGRSVVAGAQSAGRSVMDMLSDAPMSAATKAKINDFNNQLLSAGISENEIRDAWDLWRSTGSTEFVDNLANRAATDANIAEARRLVSSIDASSPAVASTDELNKSLFNRGRDNRLLNAGIPLESYDMPGEFLPENVSNVLDLESVARAAERPQVTSTATTVSDTSSITPPETSARIPASAQAEDISRIVEAPQTTTARPDPEESLAGMMNRADLTPREKAVIAKISDDAVNPTTRIDLEEAVRVDKGEKKFKYTAVDEKTGTEINDIIYANDEDTALRLIREKGLLTTNIQKEATPKIPAKAKAKNEASARQKEAKQPQIDNTNTIKDEGPAVVNNGMRSYKFEAIDAYTGIPIQDVIEAPSVADAETTLRQMGYLVTKIHSGSIFDKMRSLVGFQTGGIVYKADGGSIFKPRGTDTVPAMLTPGEFVVNRKATQANLGLLHEINNNPGTRYYQRGGLVNYLADGGQPTGGSANLGIDFSPFMDGITQFSTYVNDFKNAVDNIPTALDIDFSEFTNGITKLNTTFSIFTGSLGPLNTAASLFGAATQNIAQAVSTLSNIPEIKLNGRIEMSPIVITLDNNTVTANNTELQSTILNKVAEALSADNPGITVNILRDTAAGR